MQDSNSALSCNSCHANVDGIAYRTSCLHLLCPACAKLSFVDGHTCSICSTVLSKGEVKETVIGTSAEIEMSDSLYQIAFSTADLRNILGNLHCMRLAFSELENFVSTQLLFEASSAQESTTKALRETEDLSNQLTSTSNLIKETEEFRARNQEDLDNLLRCREKEISEMKDAYKEKHRKCQAWEKAYNNIRDQIVAPSGRESVDNKQQRHPIQQRPQNYPILQHNPSHARIDVTPPNHVPQNSNLPPSQYYRHDSVIRPHIPIPTGRQSMQPSHLPSHAPQDLHLPPSKYYRSDNVYRPLIPTGRQPIQPSHLLPPPTTIDDNPNRTVRRTEVTTYSRSLVPDGHCEEHHSQQPQQRQHLPFQREPNRIPASIGPPRPTSGAYNSSYTSTPLLQNQHLQTGHLSYVPQPQQRPRSQGVPPVYQNRNLNKRQRTEVIPARPTTPLTGNAFERIQPPIRGGGTFFDRG